MAIKDYYAILMVHPQAEPFLIEAAYKRLAREYHPDLGTARSQHEKMVELNEAFAVLSDPARRVSYDREYARQTRTQAAQVATVPATKAPPKPPTARRDPLGGSVCPVPPDPAAFGIEGDYWEQAMEGARAWKLREHRIASRVKWVVRGLCAAIGAAISVAFWWTRAANWNTVAPLAWLILPSLGELTLRLIERVRDAHLLRYKYNPLYNPNPAGYQAFAVEYAKYVNATTTVYVARDSVFHFAKTCPGLVRYEPMPKWFAQLQNAKACTRCSANQTIPPKKLPPPFGNGSIQAT